MKVDNQKRICIPQKLVQDMVICPSNQHLKVYFSEHLKTVSLSVSDKKGAIVQIGRVCVDSKNRMFITTELYKLIPELLKGQWDDLYLCLNQKKELCIKRVP